MNHLHSLGIVHGHLKSTNCVIDYRWTVKVCDFGPKLDADILNATREDHGLPSSRFRSRRDTDDGLGRPSLARSVESRKISLESIGSKLSEIWHEMRKKLSSGTSDSSVDEEEFEVTRISLRGSKSDYVARWARSPGKDDYLESGQVEFWEEGPFTPARLSFGRISQPSRASSKSSYGSRSSKGQQSSHSGNSFSYPTTDVAQPNNIGGDPSCPQEQTNHSARRPSLPAYPLKFQPPPLTRSGSSSFPDLTPKRKKPGNNKVHPDGLEMSNKFPWFVVAGDEEFANWESDDDNLMATRASVGSDVSESEPLIVHAQPRRKKSVPANGEVALPRTSLGRTPVFSMPSPRASRDMSTSFDIARKRPSRLSVGSIIRKPDLDSVKSATFDEQAATYFHHSLEEGELQSL